LSEALKPKEYQVDERLSRVDDTNTWLAEVLDGNMRSEFTYTFNGEDLIARDGRPLGPVFEKAIIDAEENIKLQPGTEFEVRRRKIEMEEYKDMIAMARGDGPNTMVVISDFPPELMGADRDQGGYNVTRRQTMLRVITRQENGNITMTSQSLDGSNRTALEAIYNFLGERPMWGELLGQRVKQNLDFPFRRDLTDSLTRVYDNSLQMQYGGEWYAGRNPVDYRNTFDFAQHQTDLLDIYLAGIQDDDAKFKLAAAITARFEQQPEAYSELYKSAPSGRSCLSPILEMEIQGRIAAQAGKTFSGCGGSVSMEFSADTELNQLGYGDNDKKNEIGANDKFGPLTFQCQRGHTNKRPPGKLIECCKTCGINVKC